MKEDEETRSSNCYGNMGFIDNNKEILREEIHECPRGLSFFSARKMTGIIFREQREGMTGLNAHVELSDQKTARKPLALAIGMNGAT